MKEIAYKTILDNIADGVFTVDEDFARSRINQAVNVPDQRRFAGAGQPHDDEDLPVADLEAGVLHTDSGRRLLEDRIFVAPLVKQLPGPLGMGPENFVELFDADLFHNSFPMALWEPEPEPDSDGSD